MKQLLFLCLLFTACTPPAGQISPDKIADEEAAGNFTRATYLIDRYLMESVPPPLVAYELQARKDRMHRIRIDFPHDRDAVLAYIHRYIPEANEVHLAQWEASQALECLVIDGQKRYFDRAAPNLFRLDADAAARKAAVDTVSAARSVLTTHLPEVVRALRGSGATQAAPQRMRVHFSVTLKADAVPAGEIVRCWLPFPREDQRRQTQVKLLAVDGAYPVLAPADSPHRSLYLEKTAQAGEPLTFGVEFSYAHAAEWFDLAHRAALPYDTASAMYQLYTAERPPHILFSDSIRAISERVVGDEADPYRKVLKLWEWIDGNFPWAGAREYGTLTNIPEYVLRTRHGDCGQVTLLFLTLARYNGIPARWQSGFAMHPGSKNLHDWSEFYIEGIGWIPMDQSFGLRPTADDEAVRYFYANGIDAYRWIVNSDYAQPLFPQKIYPRSDNVDFQRGELEWRGGNLYYDQWNYRFEVSYEN
jgi:transglutaminase-like putative cysteine protease